jgi:hypothetical protein
LDMNPCGGTHLRNLSEINLLKVCAGFIVCDIKLFWCNDD